MSKVLLCVETLLSIKATDWSEMLVFFPPEDKHVWERDRWHKGPSSFFHVPSAAWWFDVSAPPPLPDTKDWGARGHFTFIRLCFSAQLQSHRYGDGTNERGKKRRGPLCPLQMFGRDRLHFGFSNTFLSFLCRSKKPARRKWMTFLALSDLCEV